MEQNEVKAELRRIKENGYAVPDDTDAYPYAQILMEEIGSSDEEFRQLIEAVLTGWIANGVFRHKELRGLLLQAISPDYLLYEIDEGDADSVFRRASAASIAASIVAAHGHESFLSPGQLESVAEQMIEYIYLEQDTRGYIEEKGSAKAIVRGADALHAIACCLTEEQASLAYAMLEAIKEKVSNGFQIYAHFEDEHLVNVVMALWKQGFIKEMYMAAWIVHFLEIEEAMQPAQDMVTQNIKMFLRSLYFRLAEENDNLASVLLETLGLLGERDKG